MINLDQRELLKRSICVPVQSPQLIQGSYTQKKFNLREGKLFLRERVKEERVKEERVKEESIKPSVFAVEGPQAPNMEQEA